ncbi:MAG: hypothetical protein WBG37_01305 [Desulfobacterales bacterium]
MKAAISERCVLHESNLITRVGLFIGYHMKNGLSLSPLIVLCILIFITPLNSRAQQDPPAPQCCSRIFAAGLEMGWAQATALYSDVSDNEVIDHLNRAGGHIQGAYRACSAINPAWSGFRHMIDELLGLADRLRNNPIRETRTEISNRLDVLYKGYANTLKHQIVAGERVNTDTCGANYFELGHHLAWAHYTFQVAAQPGLPQKFAKDFRTFGLRRISGAKRTLSEMKQVKPVTGNCVQLWRDGFIDQTLNRMLNVKNLSTSQLVAMSQSCWEDTLEAMTDGIPRLRIDSCAIANGRRGQPGNNGGSGLNQPGTTGSGGGGIYDYRNRGTHFSCKDKQNQEGKCCCFTGSHTYRFPKGRVAEVITLFDTGKKHNCRSTVEFSVHTEGKWVTIATFDAVSSRGNDTYAPNKVSVKVNRVIDGFRLGDGCSCCIDSSEIWLH